MPRTSATSGARRSERTGLPPIGAPLRLQGIEEEVEAGLVAWFAAGAKRVLAELCENDVAALCGERWRPTPGARRVQSYGGEASAMSSAARDGEPAT